GFRHHHRAAADGRRNACDPDVGDPERRQLTFALPRHAAQRNGLATGEACSVSLLRDALHVMPRP
ncbi:MAG: hypothetical protein ACKPAC_20200, partial [Alphaproteobacteria bacterium]